MFAYNPIDKQMKPFIILHHIEQLHFPFLADFDAYLSKQDNWWIAATLFASLWIHFISELYLIRASLPSEIRELKAVLILDNHSSRINSKAITLPLYCTHVLQLFDVRVAASLKAKITKTKLISLQSRFHF